MTNPLRCEYRRGVSPDALADLPDGCAAAVVTDPPYGLDKTYDGDGTNDEQVDWAIKNDADLSQLEASILTMRRVLAQAGVCIIACAPQLRAAVEGVMAAGGLVPSHVFVWDKAGGRVHYGISYAHEDFVIAGHVGVDVRKNRKPMVSIARIPRVIGREHPNEKPVALLRRLVRWACPQGGLVVDPFAGIASCGVAALAERCSYVGVECDERWWPIAERRLAEAQDRPHPLIQQSTLFTDVA